MPTPTHTAHTVTWDCSSLVVTCNVLDRFIYMIILKREEKTKTKKVLNRKNRKERLHTYVLVATPQKYLETVTIVFQKYSIENFEAYFPLYIINLSNILIHTSLACYFAISK